MMDREQMDKCSKRSANNNTLRTRTPRAALGTTRSQHPALMGAQRPCQALASCTAAIGVSGGQFPRKSGVGKQSDAVIRGSQLNALNFL